MDRGEVIAPGAAGGQSWWRVRPRIALLLLFMLGLQVPLILFGRDVILQHGGNIAGHAYWGRDFVIWWTGGQLVANGQWHLIYDLAGFQQAVMSRFGQVDLLGYPYPPVTWPIAVLFGSLPYFLAWGLWNGLTGGVFLFACRRWWQPGMGPLWLALLTPAAAFNIWAGHWGFLLSGLFLLGFDAIARGKPLVAGIFFGCMVVKPHLAVLVPVVLLARRDWTAIGSAMVTGALLVGATVLLFGIQPWIEYFTRMTGPQVSVIAMQGTMFSLMSTSPTTAMLRMGVPSGVAWVVQLVLVVGAVGLVGWKARDRSRPREAALLAASCTFLVLPYGFNYDLNAVMVGALFTATRPSVAVPFRVLAALGFLAPSVGLPLAALGLAGIPVMLLALVVAQLHGWNRTAGSSDAGDRRRGADRGRGLAADSEDSPIMRHGAKLLDSVPADAGSYRPTAAISAYTLLRSVLFSFKLDGHALEMG